MKLILTILKFYAFGLLFSCLCTQQFNSSRVTIEYLKTTGFWIAPLVLIIVCLVVAGILLIPFKPGSRAKFLDSAVLTGFILFCMVFGSIQFRNWYHLSYLANIEANEEFLNSNAEYPAQERQAFKMLTDHYKNPNELRLISESASEYDSTVGGVAAEAHDIEFLYLRKGRMGRFKSGCTFVGNKANLRYFDRQLTLSEEHLLDSSNNEGLREGLEAILKDSVRLSLDSAARKAIHNKLKSKRIAWDTVEKRR